MVLTLKLRDSSILALIKQLQLAGLYRTLKKNIEVLPSEGFSPLYYIMQMVSLALSDY